VSRSEGEAGLNDDMAAESISRSSEHLLGSHIPLEPNLVGDEVTCADDTIRFLFAVGPPFFDSVRKDEGVWW
jgi:hypothetical protein